MSFLRPLLIALAATVLVGLTLVFLWDREPIEPWAGGPTQDVLLSLDLGAGEFDAVTHTDGTLQLTATARRGFPRRGRWTSDPIARAGIVEVLPSWNVDCPPGTGMRVYGRTLDPYTKTWSPWLSYGYWGKVPPPRYGTSFDGGAVAVDILELQRRQAAVQFRVDFFDYNLTNTSPSLRQMRVALRTPGPSLAPDQPKTPVDLDVPFLAQRTAGDRIGGEVCSPTSTTMVAAFHGVESNLVENALTIYDPEHDLFGNWNRAVQRAAELGLAGHLERFSQWSQVEQHLLAGRPIIASINFTSGQCPSFVMDATDGHLIVVRGITADGVVIVNDGASAGKGERALYNADELRTAWFENAGGVGYVIYPRAALAVARE